MAEGTAPAPGRRCPWCSEPTASEATHCPACGAALAQRETIGGLVIPGVTTVDPALQAYAAQPLRISGNSPSQGMAGGAVVAAAAAGGPLGLAALAGLAAVAASEYLGASHGASGSPADAKDIGRPSEAVLQALERLDREAAAPPDPTTDAEPRGPVGDATMPPMTGVDDTLADGAPDPAAPQRPLTRPRREPTSDDGGRARSSPVEPDAGAG